MTNYRILYNNRTGCFVIYKNNTIKKKNVETNPIIDVFNPFFYPGIDGNN